jgi:2-methylaconitate cis-trans-isomerase PrpF
MHAAGAPCPTLVIDARSLPTERPALLTTLGLIRRQLTAADCGHVLKFALVAPSTAQGADLDYQFIQALPDGPDSFDLRGSCGHSLLGAAVAAADSGMLPDLAPGQLIRVHVLNNGDRVTCEVERAFGDAVLFTARFEYNPPRAAGDLLLTSEPLTLLDVPGLDTPEREVPGLIPSECVPVSLVSTGNPYVFVDGTLVGAARPEALFAGGDRLLARLGQIRAAAAALLGWPSAGAFPKIAAVLPSGEPGGIAVRAVSVPSWHPTLALTGSVCLAAAINIPYTVPWLAARSANRTAGAVAIHTAGGRWPVSVAMVTDDARPRVAEVVVGHRKVTRHGALPIELPAHLFSSLDPVPAPPVTSIPREDAA